MPNNTRLIRKLYTSFSKPTSNAIFKKTQVTEFPAAEMQNFPLPNVRKKLLSPPAPASFFALRPLPKSNLSNRGTTRFFSTEIFANPDLLTIFFLSANAVTNAFIFMKLLEQRYNSIENIATQMVQQKPITSYMNLQKWHKPFIEPIGNIFYSTCIKDSEIREGIARLMREINRLATKEDKTRIVLEIAAIAAQMKQLIILMPDPITSGKLFAPGDQGYYLTGKRSNYIVLQQKHISNNSISMDILTGSLLHEITHAIDYLINLKPNQGKRKNKNALIDALNKDLQLHETTPLNGLGASFKEIKKNYDESKLPCEIIAFYIQFMSFLSHERMEQELPEISKCMNEMFFNPCEDFLHEHKKLADTSENITSFTM